jgi:hypothetical protein
MDKLTWNDGATPETLKQRAWKAFARSGGYAALVAELLVLSKVVADGGAEEELKTEESFDTVEQTLDIRLQFKGKRFAVFAGDAARDGDATGSWAGATVRPGLKQSEACTIADGLLDQVLDDWVRYGYRSDDASDEPGPRRSLE